ncbi:hypothetical protein ACEE25_08685 [Clostridium perfringens]|uniref:hypothetical protein n=1 Tax=Clostridium perfringens TaxID=1502 RepID=UPI0011B1F207|nr:hypothetical protein [Clostridium perfringens]
MELLEGQMSVFDIINEPKKVYRFSKKLFRNNAPANIKRTLAKHLDVLDGMEVNFDKEDGEIFEYIVNGEAYCLYPVSKEWCTYE